MADPATLALIGTAITAGGAVVGGIQQGQAASYQAAVARNNALISQQNAAYAASATAAQAEQSGLAEREKQAQLRAGIAANGLDVNSGSAADLQESQRKLGDLETRTVTSNAAKQVYGYESQASGYEAQAKLDEAQAGFAPIAGVIKGAGAVLSNPTADARISGAFGGGITPSLVGSDPVVGSDYSWMRNTTPQEDWEIGA